ncbi:DUF5060 domain-containing protein [Neorhodopirellula pilleata]|uniref:DUF5060 domain-containing protein n=1 Tax=Neorhodopirellula pilleata TaxID=2714738 RepID=A0A5C6AV87_9BACT|nr:DUF5060 domain-containing protein [Neorhodopirellula pilleata]TWU03935.1 hypothetical protein Pla100_08710 [Neorhodopirellula pilleata]
MIVTLIYSRTYAVAISAVAALLALPSFVHGTARADENVSAICWQPHDFAFTANTAIGNPFQTQLTALVNGPNGTSFTIPGFYAGDGTWKIRVAPTSEGNWSLTTKSGVSELNGRTVSFSCIKNSNPNVKGVLQVDKAYPHHFILADGTRFFMQAYEYDWLWALDMGKPDVPTVEKSLDLLARHGFIYVILNTYAHDTKWRKGKSGPDDYGPPELFPWEGSNESPDHSRMNVDYWQHYDRVMTAIMERGIQAHILIKVYNKSVTWPEKGSPELEPSDTLVSNGYCLAQPGREYIAFRANAQSFTLNIAGAPSTLTGEWFHPLTGNRSSAGKFENGLAKVDPPTDSGSAPLVLHVFTTPKKTSDR